MYSHNRSNNFMAKKIAVIVISALQIVAAILIKIGAIILLSGGVSIGSFDRSVGVILLIVAALIFCIELTDLNCSGVKLNFIFSCFKPIKKDVVRTFHWQTQDFCSAQCIVMMLKTYGTSTCAQCKGEVSTPLVRFVRSN